MLAVSAILFFLSIIMATRIAQKALASLVPEEKVKLVDLAAGTSSKGFVLLALVVAAWLAVCFFLKQYAIAATAACLGIILLMSLGSAIAMQRRLRKAGMPEAFLRSYLFARSLRLLGAGVFFLTMCLWLFQATASHA